MSSNKAAKQALIRRYGNVCFIERLHLRDTKGLKYTGCGQYKRMKQLTYHHILEKSKGGKATIENGALLSAENHEWFHKQPKEVQRKMNNMFQELKREMDRQELRIEYVDEMQCPFETTFAELFIDKKGLNVKKLHQQERAKEKRELQKLRKDWEDR